MRVAGHLARQGFGPFLWVVLPPCCPFTRRLIDIFHKASQDERLLDPCCQ
jgi:hypothetical protein